MTAKPDPEQSKKRILEDHRQIAELLEQCTSTADPSQIHANMKRLQALLGRHFGEEESQLGGLHETTQALAPRYARSLQELKEEHREFLETVRELIDRSANAGGDDPGLREQSKELQRRFVAHEARETEIFVESIWTDVGTKD